MTVSKTFRLLPTTIITAFLLVCIKVIGMVQDTKSLFIGNVEAQQPEKPSNVSTEKPTTVDKAVKPEASEAKKTAEEKTSEAKSADAKNGESKSSESKGEAKTSDGKESKGEAKSSEEGHGEKEGKKEKTNPNVSKELDNTTDHRYTAVEVELLQTLSKRREELDRWQNNIEIKESTLGAAEKRIDDKINQIESMKKQVAALLAQYNAQEDAKIRSLVKIYENMKPADAARIFDEVEMPILLLVIDAMAEKKAAPILAAMNPNKAKQLTVELANERKINNKVTSGAESQVAAPKEPVTPAAKPNPSKP